MSRPPVGVGENRRPATGGPARGGRDAEHRSRGATGGIVQHLPQLGKAQLDQPVEALADLGLRLDEAHREASGLAQLEARERIAHRQLVAHGVGVQVIPQPTRATFN